MKKIVIIGAGNLATHLSMALQNANFNILQIYSRTILSAQTLATQLNTKYTNHLSEINQNADLYIIAVSDTAISEVLKNKIFHNKFLLHTCGSVSIDVFRKCTNNYGVFYPLQTFTKSIKLNFKTIPICIEANTLENKTHLIYIAQKISTNIYEINSEQRKTIHLAAIFANNFTNHLFNIASQIVKEKNIPYEILTPLIEQTAKKVLNNKPSETQTGPAVRNDKKTIQEHIKMLKNYPDFQQIYKILSSNITKNYFSV